jgi:Bacterial regulatory helix-turn-helix proteins, AraC family
MLLSEQFYQTEKQDTWTNNSDFFILKTRPERNSLTIIMIFTR